MKKKTTLFILTLLSLYSNSQNFSIVLGRPTDQAITASILFDINASYYLVYGTQSNNYNDSTAIGQLSADIPIESDISGLIPNQRYYYRMRYKGNSQSTYQSTPEYCFHTQRANGESFTFTLEADEHLYDKKGVDNMYRITLANQAADNPDFMLSLGDIFGDDHTPDETTNGAMDSLHRDYRPFLGEICHSVPFYVCLGNHEGENDFYLNNNPPYNIGVYGTMARKKYYPNPYPNNFYTGNQSAEGYGMDNPENYYAWNWGNALFVVLDVYRTECKDSLVAKPQGWNWTLGEEQYNWLLSTLQNSTATHKFVFAHHVRGQGRGGILEAQLYEWGGYQNLNGNNTFSIYRPGWPMSIQDMFVQYGVNIFFQGHDHVFAHEVLGGVTYQSLPMAADSTYQIGMLANADAYTTDTVDGTGHIRVKVSSDCIKVDYIKAYLPADTLSGLHHNREIGFSYTIGTCIDPSSVGENKVSNWKIFPNPSTDFCYLVSESNHPIDGVVFYDQLGQKVLKTRFTKIDISSLSSGIYTVEIISNDLKEFSKLIIQK